MINICLQKLRYWIFAIIMFKNTNQSEYVKFLISKYIVSCEVVLVYIWL